MASKHVVDERYTLRVYGHGTVPTVTKRLSERDAIARAMASIVKRDEANALAIDIAGQLVTVGMHTVTDAAALLGVTRPTLTDWVRVAACGVDLIDSIAQGHNLTSVYVVSKAVVAGSFDLSTGLKLLHDHKDAKSFRAAIAALGLDMSGKQAKPKSERAAASNAMAGAVVGTALQQIDGMIDGLSLDDLALHITACQARFETLKAKPASEPAKATGKPAKATGKPASKPAIAN
jgi:hypothetical protein